MWVRREAEHGQEEGRARQWVRGGRADQSKALAVVHTQCIACGAGQLVQAPTPEHAHAHWRTHKPTPPHPNPHESHPPTHPIQIYTQSSYKHEGLRTNLLLLAPIHTQTHTYMCMGHKPG